MAGRIGLIEQRGAGRSNGCGGLRPDWRPRSFYARKLLEEYLRDKHLLLVLDDSELVIADCARLADTLLRLCPGLHILVTSRELLGLEGEIPFSVPSMTFPDPLRLPPLEHLNQYEAVHLFVDRARSISPNFTITEENARDIASICKRLDGIPLAIELAAARVKILSVKQIANHLEESLDFWQADFAQRCPVTRPCARSIDWSYQMLAKTNASYYVDFRFFPEDGHSRRAKQFVQTTLCLAGSVIDLLTQLVNKSLVIVEQQPIQHIRYYLLDAIWEFAHEKLVRGR